MKSIKIPFLLFVLLCGAELTIAQDKSADIEAIKSMCGCYAVTFDYAETFSPDTNYVLHDQYHTTAPAEWVFIEEATDNKIVLQHLLVVGEDMIIKHWRQDWIYQNQDFHHFYKDRTWNYSRKEPKAVAGQWTQKVYQVDDSPRYQGSATWVHVDGRHYWENLTDAPLPRREFTKRSDYNVMKRRNRQEITDYGWIHEQDNYKIIRDGNNDQLLVEEKGLNKYVKIEDAKCQAAADWWIQNKAYWALVRQAWDELFAQQTDIKLAPQVNDKKLFEALFALGDELNTTAASNPKQVREKITKTIEDFLVAETQTGMNQ
jgi:hypothetical protein